MYKANVLTANGCVIALYTMIVAGNCAHHNEGYIIISLFYMACVVSV